MSSTLNFLEVANVTLCEHSFAHLLYLFKKLLLGFGLDFEFGLGLTLELCLELELGLR